MIENVNNIRTTPVMTQQEKSLDKAKVVSIFMLMILAEKSTLDGNDERQKLTKEKQRAAAALAALQSYEEQWAQDGYNTDEMKKVLAQFEKAGLIDDSVWGQQLKDEITGNIDQIAQMKESEKNLIKIADQYNKDKKKLEKYEKEKDKDSCHTSVIKWLVNGWKEWVNPKYRHECGQVDKQQDVLQDDEKKLAAAAKDLTKKYGMPASSTQDIVSKLIPEQEKIAEGKMSGYLENTHNQLNTVASQEAQAEKRLLQEVMGQNLI